MYEIELRQRWAAQPDEQAVEIPNQAFLHVDSAYSKKEKSPRYQVFGSEEIEAAEWRKAKINIWSGFGGTLEQEYLQNRFYPMLAWPCSVLGLFAAIQVYNQYNSGNTDPAVIPYLETYRLCLMITASCLLVFAVSALFKRMGPYLDYGAMVCTVVVVTALDGFDAIVDFRNTSKRPPVLGLAVCSALLLGVGSMGMRSKHAMINCVILAILHFLYVSCFPTETIAVLTFPIIVSIGCTIRASMWTEILLRRNFKRDRILEYDILSLKKARTEMDSLLAMNLPASVIKLLRETGGDFDLITASESDTFESSGTTKSAARPKVEATTNGTVGGIPELKVGQGSNLSVNSANSGLGSGRRLSAMDMLCQTSSQPVNVAVVFTEVFDRLEMSDTKFGNEGSNSVDTNDLNHIRELVVKINFNLEVIEGIVQSRGGELIKNIGSKVLIAVGLGRTKFKRRSQLVETALAISKDIIASLHGRKSRQHGDLQVKSGIHLGPVSSAIIGDLKFTFDIFGDTVNTASRLLQMCPYGCVFMSDTVASHIKDKSIDNIINLGIRHVKGKGYMEIWGLGVTPSANEELIQCRKSPILEQPREDIDSTESSLQSNSQKAKAPIKRSKSLVNTIFKRKSSSHLNEGAAASGDLAIDVPPIPQQYARPHEETFSRTSSQAFMVDSTSQQGGKGSLGPRAIMSLFGKSLTAGGAGSKEASTSTDLSPGMQRYSSVMALSHQSLAVATPQSKLSLSVMDRSTMSVAPGATGSNLIINGNPNARAHAGKNIATPVQNSSTMVRDQSKMFHIPSSLFHNSSGIFQSQSNAMVRQNTFDSVGSSLLDLGLSSTGLGDESPEPQTPAKAAPSNQINIRKASINVNIIVEEIFRIYGARDFVTWTGRRKSSALGGFSSNRKTRQCTWIESFIECHISTGSDHFGRVVERYMHPVLLTFRNPPLEYKYRHSHILSSEELKGMIKDYCWVLVLLFIDIVISGLAFFLGVGNPESAQQDRRAQVMLGVGIGYLMKISGQHARELCDAELEKSAFVLRNTFNERVINCLTTNPEAGIIQLSENASVLALDIIGFTYLSSKLTAFEVVYMFDSICVNANVEKICTIGDAYIAVAGLPQPLQNPSLTICQVALDMQKIIASFNPRNEVVVARNMSQTTNPLAVHQQHQSPPIPNPRSFSAVPDTLQARVGISTGTVACALIGGRIRLKYDVMGKSVEKATLLEQTATPGTVHICTRTRKALLEWTPGCVLEERVEASIVAAIGEASYTL
ncbi:hypothetical protein HDU76_011263, partial [Blyttiomyces sp. JEL0837]